MSVLQKENLKSKKYYKSKNFKKERKSPSTKANQHS